jgi:uroporphyrinogen decarboxylase
MGTEDMNPRQRVLAALEHRQPDKVPWEFDFTNPALDKLAEYYGDPRLTDTHFFADWVGNHFRSVGPQCRGQFHGLEEEVKPGLWRDGWGIVWDTRGLYGEGEWGRPVNCVLPEPTLAHYTFPDPPCPDAFAHYQPFVEENQAYFLVGNEGHLFEVAWALRGIEDFLMDLILHPGFVAELLEGITEYYLAVIDRSVAYGIDAFAFGDDLGSQTMGLIMSPGHWRQYFKPCLARMFARVKEAGKYVYLHSDGQVDAIFDDLVEIGLDIYNPFQPEIRDVYETKRNYGDRLCFHGGVGIQELLPHGTPVQVKSEVQRLIAHVGVGGGYILGSAHSVMADAPVENIVALIEAVQEQ